MTDVKEKEDVAINEEDAVIKDLGEHINNLGIGIQAMIEFSKGQDVAIKTIADFLSKKYGIEFSDFVKKEYEKVNKPLHI